MDLKCLVCKRQVHYAQLSTFESWCWLIAVTLPLATLASLAHTLRPQWSALNPSLWCSPTTSTQFDAQQTSKPWSFYIKRPRVFIQQSKTGVLFRRGRRYFVTYWDNVWFTYFCNKFPCLVFHYHISHLPLNVIHKDKDKEKNTTTTKITFSWVWQPTSFRLTQYHFVLTDGTQRHTRLWLPLSLFSGKSLLLNLQDPHQPLSSGRSGKHW